MSAECCESFAGTDVRGKTISNSIGAAERKPREPNEMLQRAYIIYSNSHNFCIEMNDEQDHKPYDMKSY